jgi:hypothetical protein
MVKPSTWTYKKMYFAVRKVRAGNTCPVPFARKSTLGDFTQKVPETHFLYRWFISGFLAVFAIVIGCSDPKAPQLVPLSGKILLNGQAVTAGSVFLHPGETAEYTNDQPSSILQIDGSFTMKTFPYGEGVAPGDYTMTLAPELAQRLSKSEYASPEKSPWKILVPQSGTVDLVLEIE